MLRGALLNVLIQVGMAGIRYFLQLHAFKNVPLETVGQLSLVLTFITSCTFVAGLELHQHLNRPLLLSDHKHVRGMRFRGTFSAAALLLLALAFPMISGVKPSYGLIVLIFIASVLEYLNLELGRLLIINKRYLMVTALSALRGLAPFIPGLFQEISLEVSLMSWAAVSLLSAASLLWALSANRLVQRSREPLTRADIAPTLRFFVVGGVTALLPFIERLCIARIFGLDTLGVYALIIMFVGMGDLLLQGVLWQPFLRTVTKRLAEPRTWQRTTAALLGITMTIYGVMFVGLALFSTMIFDFLQKQSPPVALITAVFLAGTARGSFTICFQLYYANHAERLLPYLQAGIAVSILLSYYVAATFGLGLVSVLLMVASSWMVFPAIALTLHLPAPLRRQVS